jgi:hypothetical protein
MRRVLSAGLWLALASATAAQAAEPWTLEAALGLDERLALSVDHRTRYEYLDNQFRAGRPGSDQILALRTRIRAQFRFTDWLSVGAEFQDSRAYLEDDNTQVGTGLVNAAELLRAYLELSLDGPFDGHHRAQMGRVTMDIGSRRLVARNRFRNTSNAFTGVDWHWLGKKGRELQFFYVLPVKRLPDDREGLRNNDIEFDRDSFDYQFLGFFFTGELPWGDTGELYTYGLYEKETYDVTDGFNIPQRRLATPGFRLMRDPEEGRFDYQFEAMFQTGTSRTQLAQSESQDHFGHSYHLTLGYTFQYPGSPRVLFHYDYASGDRKPLDGDNQRFDTLFGSRRFEWAPTSIYGAFSRSNINTPGVRIELEPSVHWSAFIDYRAVWLASNRDEWVGTGVRDPSGNSGSFVGQQIEMRAQWRPLPGNLMLEAGYAHLFAGEFIDKAPNANGGDTNYVYSQVVLEF